MRMVCRPAVVNRLLGGERARSTRDRSGNEAADRLMPTAQTDPSVDVGIHNVIEPPSHRSSSSLFALSHSSSPPLPFLGQPPLTDFGIRHHREFKRVVVDGVRTVTWLHFVPCDETHSRTSMCGVEMQQNRNDRHRLEQDEPHADESQRRNRAETMRHHRLAPHDGADDTSD
jgi:hypothetical protein